MPDFSEISGDLGPGVALAEHVRRLGISRPGVDQTAAQVDLTKPIRLIADTEANALVVASTPASLVPATHFQPTLAHQEMP